MELSFIPAFLLRLFSKDSSVRIHLNILFSNIIVIMLLVLIGHQPALLRNIPHECISQKLLHIQCPGCGITTGLMDFFCGRIREAYIANPVSILTGIFFIFQAGIRYVAIRYKELGDKVNRASAYTDKILITTLFSYYIFNLLTHALCQ